jgi:hypothetical protein
MNTTQHSKTASPVDGSQSAAPERCATLSGVSASYPPNTEGDIIVLATQLVQLTTSHQTRGRGTK